MLGTSIAKIKPNFQFKRMCCACPFNKMLIASNVLYLLECYNDLWRFTRGKLGSINLITIELNPSNAT